MKSFKLQTLTLTWTRRSFEKEDILYNFVDIFSCAILSSTKQNRANGSVTDTELDGVPFPLHGCNAATLPRNDPFRIIMTYEMTDRIIRNTKETKEKNRTKQSGI